MDQNLDRRDFLQATAYGVISMGLLNRLASGQETVIPTQTTIPRWRGFNLLDYFSPNPPRRFNHPGRTTEDDFRWMADWGFDFVRLPMAYPRWLDFDRSQPITPADMTNYDTKVVDEIDALVQLAHKYGLHVSLNFHRAPGFCVNAGFNEPFNLWFDHEAQEAFYQQWSMWAQRYKDMSSSQISFDLFNEPCLRADMNDQHSQRSAVPGDLYRKIAQEAAQVIRAANPDHLIIADGNNVGNDVIPEIVDLNIAQSCRGYFPGLISHYKAPWAFKDVDRCPTPVWPGQVGDQRCDRGRLEEFYHPWIELTQQGVGVHCGECGCWKMTPHEVFLAWFGDVLDILTENGIGYALWNFRGDFGIMDSGRADVTYEDWHGHQLDRKLLDLLISH